MLSFREEHIALASQARQELAMVSHEGSVGGKKHYTTPRLMTHGTLKDITLLRFNWHRRPDLGEDPVAKVS